jgi:hypothetical protein
MKQQYIVQPWGAEQYAELFRIAMRDRSYTEFYAAVAYATWGGVRVLDRVARECLGSGWDGTQKRWLVGVDWCRSDPAALDRLAALPNSAVRVPNGESLVRRAGCRATTPYHPKLFVFRGEAASAIICGSGNLSASGLTKGCECGCLSLVNHRQPDDGDGPRQLTCLLAWFEDSWGRASDFASLVDGYRQRCKRLLKDGRSTPTDDDGQPVSPTEARRRRTLTDSQIRALRTFDSLWIEAGALGANLGRGVPGNQLDMTRYMRVFFGVPAVDVAKNTELDQIALVWDGEHHADRTLRFGDNGMDKLNVPSAGDRGPMFYRDKTLLFTRQPDGAYRFVVGDRARALLWKRRSSRLGQRYEMPGGREWGLL